MNETVFVRELPEPHRGRLGAAKTGDRLEDGSVLLLSRDLDRMGLNELRGWIARHVFEERATVSFADEGTGLPRRPLDELVV